MSLEIAKKALSFFMPKYKKIHVKFFGGEPLLNFKLIKDLVSWSELYPGIFHFSLTTNGTLLDNHKINYFKEKKINLKVSFDGSLAQVKNRPSEGSNNLSSAPLKKLKMYEEKLEKLKGFYLRSTCYDGDKRSLENLLDEMLGKFRVAIAFVENEEKESSLEEAKKIVLGIKKVFVNFILNLDSEGRIKESLKILNISYMVSLIESHKPLKSFCSAGINYFSVSSSGDFFLCHRFNEDSRSLVGSVKIGLDSDKLNKVKDFRSNLKEPCKSCWVQNLCRGGCLHEHKMSFHKNPFFCEIQKMEVELALFYIKLSSENI